MVTKSLVPHPCSSARYDPCLEDYICQIKLDFINRDKIERKELSVYCIFNSPYEDAEFCSEKHKQAVKATEEKPTRTYFGSYGGCSAGAIR